MAVILLYETLCNMHCLGTHHLTCCGVTGYNKLLSTTSVMTVTLRMSLTKLPLLHPFRPETPALPIPNPRIALVLPHAPPSGLHVTCQNLRFPHKTAAAFAGLRGQTVASDDAASVKKLEAS